MVAVQWEGGADVGHDGEGAGGIGPEVLVIGMVEVVETRGDRRGECGFAGAGDARDGDQEAARGIEGLE